MNDRLRAPVFTCGALLLAGIVSADTLVLRNGRRLEGELIAVRGDTIEFDERRGLDGRNTVRFDRREVRSIDLDSGNGWSGHDDSRGGGRGDSAPDGAGVRERIVTVDARNKWTDTGIDLRAGQRIRFQSRGEVRWGPGRKDGAGGEGGSHTNPNRPIPNRPAASLIGRAGGGNDVFFIGDDQGEIRIRNAGRLFLGLNDDYLQDNSGSLQVTVYY